MPPGGQGRDRPGAQALDGGLAGLRVHPAVIDGLDPGGEEAVERRQVGHSPGLHFDQELDAHGLEEPLDLPPALRPSWLAVDVLLHGRVG